MGKTAIMQLVTIRPPPLAISNLCVASLIPVNLDIVLVRMGYILPEPADATVHSCNFTRAGMRVGDLIRASDRRVDLMCALVCV
jgi:hypothetical protein